MAILKTNPVSNKPYITIGTWVRNNKTREVFRVQCNCGVSDRHKTVRYVNQHPYDFYVLDEKEIAEYNTQQRLTASPLTTQPQPQPQPTAR